VFSHLHLYLRGKFGEELKRSCIIGDDMGCVNCKGRPCLLRSLAEIGFMMMHNWEYCEESLTSHRALNTIEITAKGFYTISSIFFYFE